MKNNSITLSALSLALCVAFTYFAQLETRNTNPDTNPVYLFSHGIVNDHTQAYQFAKDDLNTLKSYDHRYLFDGELVTFDYPDAPFKLWKTSFGQQEEMACLYNQWYGITTRQEKPSSLVLVGLSRGASALINFVGTYNPHSVDALVLESPYDSVSNLKNDWKHLKNKVKQILLGSIAAPCLGLTQFNENGIHPIDCAKTIDTDLPIFLTCSLKDTTVPAAATIRLYQALLESGHTQVYIFVAPYGKHSKILRGKSGLSYQYAVHAFYKHYNLPHNPLFAENGKHILQTCQPKSTKIQLLLAQLSI